MFYLFIVGAVLFLGMGFIGLAALLIDAFNNEELKPKSRSLILGIISICFVAGVVLGARA
ncbi:MAG: hypothetical protein L0Z62_00530 [Gemmataceae bacterium]|nr:hypothetical protein [Gemmataceae bacterium]